VVTVADIFTKTAHCRGDNPEFLKRGISLAANLDRLRTVIDDLDTHRQLDMKTVDYWGVDSSVKELDITQVNSPISMGTPVLLGQKQGFYGKSYVPLEKYTPCELKFPFPQNLPKGRYTFSFHQDFIEPQIEPMVYGISSYYDSNWVTENNISFSFTEELTVSLRFPLTTQPLKLPISVGPHITFTTFDIDMTVLPQFICIQSRLPLTMGGFKLEQGAVATPSASGAAERLASLAPIQILGHAPVIRDSLFLEETVFSGHFPAEFWVTHTGMSYGDFSLTTDLGRLDFQEQQALVYGLACLIDRATLDGSPTYAMQVRQQQYDRYANTVKYRGLRLQASIRRGLV
jgi:hypothetical protein